MTFRRPDYRERRQAEKAANLAALAIPSRALHRSTYCGTTSGERIEKEEPTKPGKTAPTKAEREWMDAIVRLGCIACRIDGHAPRPTAVHHILRNGQRIGHLYTLPLCDPGHHQAGEEFAMVSRHPWKARFEARYGSEMELLERVRQEVKERA